MKIIAHSSYWPAVGGGEAHFGKLCEVLSRKNEVDLLYNGIDFIPENEKKFNLDLSMCKKTRLQPSQFSEYSRGADLFLCYTHHIEFVPRGKINILFCTIPWFKYPHISEYNLLIANSEFTAKFLRTRFSNIDVLYPYIDSKYKPCEKRNIILTVGRFNQDLHCKMQFDMIREFKNADIDFCDFKKWKLIVTGMSKFPSEVSLFEKCKMLSRQSNKIDVTCNLQFEDIVRLNGEAKIYWHATGFSDIAPEKVEHCGMGVMNAMASGCVPLVVNKGEPPHLVEYPDQIWSTWDELVEKTRWWILNPERLSKRAKEMVANAKKYSDESFWFSTQKIFSKFGVKF